MPWVAKIKATDGGLLFGGVRVHESSPFVRRENVDAWAEQCARTNREAGRDCTVEIVPRMVAHNKCADYVA